MAVANKQAIATEGRTFSQPDDVRAFDHGRIEFVKLGEVTLARAPLQPGWRWSTCIKPFAGTASCEVSHLQYHFSGRLHLVMDDGSELEFGPGDVSRIA